MNKNAIVCSLVYTLMLGFGSPDQGQNLNAPPPEQARALVKRGIELRERDRFQEAVAAFKEAIALAPNYLNGHAEYIRTKTYFLDKYDEAKAEYETLMAKEPENPIYPMALVNGQMLTPNKRVWLEKVANLAPEWVWGHFAKGSLLQGKDPEAAVAELLQCLEKDNTIVQAYHSIIYIREKQGRIDDALSIAEQMVAQPQVRASGLGERWRLRLAKAQGSEKAEAVLREELAQLATSSSDIVILIAIRSAYSSLLKDAEAARAIEVKIRQIDPTWYPERGQALYIATANESGIPRQVAAANHQYAINERIGEISDQVEPKERIARLEKLLSLNPTPAMTWRLYQQLFRAAEKAGDPTAMVKYGEAMYKLDPSDTVVLAKMALVLADQKKDLQKAQQYARLADEATAQFRPATRPANTDAVWFESGFPHARQQREYLRQRALALDTIGWVLHQMGKYTEAEAKLRQAIETDRSEQRLLHLAETLRRLRRTDESEKVAREAEREWIEGIKRQFKSQPAQDFQLEAIDGRSYRLSALKGKVVLLNFWATWCGPCVKEMPDLIKVYDQYKDQGLEILAISVDSKTDRYKVAPFARDQKLTFPILFDEDVATLYKVTSYPTNIFIDRNGNVRYQVGSGTARLFEAVIGELLK